jgi:hypothetical protein
MSSSIFRSALAGSVAAGLVFAPSALARGPVYGGSTSAMQAIVLRTDAKAKKLKSAVIAWSADCKVGSYWADGSDLTALKADPGFEPDPGELAVTRNAGGRFSGVQAYATSGGRSHRTRDSRGRRTDQGQGCERHAARERLARRRQRQRAGRLRHGHRAVGREARAGRIFGGATSQDAPMVIRLDSPGRKVSDVMTGWGARCVPDGCDQHGRPLHRLPDQEPPLRRRLQLRLRPRRRLEAHVRLRDRGQARSRQGERLAAGQRHRGRPDRRADHELRLRRASPGRR